MSTRLSPAERDSDCDGPDVVFEDGPCSPHVSLVIPAYNEQTRLPDTLQAIERFIVQHGFDCEVIVVDNGSLDATSTVVREAMRRWPWLRLLKTDRRGKGLAVRTGILASRGEIVLFADADLSWSVEDLHRFPALISNGAAVVVGSREEPGAQRVGAPVYRRLMSRVFNGVVQACAVAGFKDTQCGFKAFRSDAARAIFSCQRIDDFGFDVEVLFLARRLGYGILEAPLRWEHREGSRVEPVRDALRMLRDVLTVRINAACGRYSSPNRLPSNPPVPLALG